MSSVANKHRSRAGHGTIQRVIEAERGVADALRGIRPGSLTSLVLHRSAAKYYEAIAELTADSLSMLSDVHHGGGTDIEDAVKELMSSHVHALAKKGITEPVARILVSLVDGMVAAQSIKLASELIQRFPSNVAQLPTTASDNVLDVDVTKCFNAREMGESLGGLGEDSVRIRERDRKLFAIMRPGRRRGREYPAFQTWDGIVGKPLERVLKALSDAGGGETYGFFTSPNDLLDGLTPIEVLLGKRTNEASVSADALALLAAKSDERIAAVEAAAQATAADLAA